MNGRSFSARPMRLIAHRVHAACVDPAVVKVEQRADGDRIVNGFVRITGRVQSIDVRRLNRDRVLVHLADKAKQRLLRIGKLRRLDIFQYALHQFRAAQQFRRDRGVGFRSKRALIPARCVSSNELTRSGAERGRPAQNLLSKSLQVNRRIDLVREHVQDLRVLLSRLAHHVDRARIVIVSAMLLDVFQKHGSHKF